MTDFATADAGQEIRLQCSPIRRVILDHNDDEMQTIGNVEVVLSFPPAIHSPKKSSAVTPTTRTARISHPPAARTAPRRRLAADAGHKSLLDVSRDTSYDCANTTRDDSSFDYQLHGGGGGGGGHDGSHNLTGLGLSAHVSAINDDGDLQHEADVDFVPRILFPEEMMHGTSGPTDGDIADVEDDFDHDDASDIEDEEEEDEYTHSDYLNMSHQSSAAHSSPFKDLTNVGGGGKQQQKQKANDITEATASLSASFFHNLSSTFADSFCVGSADSPGGVHRTPQASPFRGTVIPRASPSLEGPAETPHRPHHLPRPSPSRSLVLSTPMRTMTPRRLVTVSSGDAADSSINKSTLSEMEDAVREHFHHLDCYANTGTPIQTPGWPPADRTPQKQQLMVSGCSTETEDDANLLVTTSNRNRFCNRSAQPVHLQTERVRRLYFHGTPSASKPYSNDDPALKLEMAADLCLLSRRRQVESSGSDAPSFVVSRAASFDDISFNGSKIGEFFEESAREEEHDTDLSVLIDCINPISILNEIEQDAGRMDTVIPSDDVCYDSDPGGVEQALSRRKHFDLGSASTNGVHREGVGSKKIQRTLDFSIATAQQTLNETISLTWHPEALEDSKPAPPRRITLWMDRGQTLSRNFDGEGEGLIIEPQILWRESYYCTTERRTKRPITAKVIKTPNTIAMLSISRIVECDRLTTGLDRAKYPFAMASHSLIIRTCDVGEFVFQARSTEERNDIVCRWKHVVSRLAGLAIKNDGDAITREFFRSHDDAGGLEDPWRVMENVA